MANKVKSLPVPIVNHFEDITDDAATVSRIKIYPKSAKAPYAVFIRKNDTAIDAFHIADELHAKYESVVEVLKVSNSKVKVTFTSRKEVNDLIKQCNTRQDFHASVPSHRVEVVGVISDPIIGTRDVINKGIGKFKHQHMEPARIVEVNRLAQFSKEFNRYVPSCCIRVTFSGTVLPDFVEVNRVLLPVRLYYTRPMFCKSCKKFGHTTKHCNLHCDTNVNESTCSRCDDTHSSPNECPFFKKRSTKLAKQQKKNQRKIYREALDSANLKQQLKEPIIDEPKSAENAPSVSTFKTIKKKTNKKGKTQQATEMSSRQKQDRSSLFTVAQVIEVLSEQFQLDATWKQYLRGFTPLISYFWKEFIHKYPKLGLFIAP